MKVSTQIQNFSVQKAWLREGFFLREAYDTFHINPFLNYSVIENQTFELEISNCDIRSFAEFSGDFNDIHFSDDYAKSIGLEGKIAHGIISSSFISKHFGTVFPGSGTLFINHLCNYYSPIYPDVKYKCVISYPYIDKKKSIYKAVAKIYDLDGDLCLVSYNTLIKK